MNNPGSVHGLTAENILTEFPVSLQYDPSVAALAEVTARLLAHRPGEIERLRIYPAIDSLDEKLLDILAYDYKVDWWDPDYSLEEKRRTLADSWHVHKILGTKSAVETAIRDIYPKTEVKEWFEYEGGKPYHFKLSIDLSDTFGDETRPWRVLERVNFYKSLRSHMDEIVFTMTTRPATLYAGGSFGANASIGIPAGTDKYNAETILRAGGAVGIHSASGVPTEPDKPEFSGSLHAGGTVTAQSSFPVSEEQVVSVKVSNCNSTYTITAAANNGVEYTTSLATGAYYGQYTAMLSVFNATINVMAVPGAEVRAERDSEVFRATANSSGMAAVRVNQAGSYTITATKDNAASNNVSVNVTAESTYTATVKFIKLTVTSEAGASLTLANGAITLMGSGTGTDVFYLPNTGTWTATLTNTEETATRSITVSAYQDYRDEQNGSKGKGFIG